MAGAERGGHKAQFGVAGLGVQVSCSGRPDSDFRPLAATPTGTNIVAGT